MKKQCIPAIRLVIVAISICLISHAYAASPFYDLDASPDIAVDLSGTITTGNQAARDNLSGTITLLRHLRHPVRLEDGPHWP